MPCSRHGPHGGDGVLTHFASEFTKSAGSRGVHAVRSALRRLLRLEPADTATDVDLTPITPQQLAPVRWSAVERAMALDLPGPKADLPADALIGALTVTGPTPTGEGGG